MSEPFDFNSIHGTAGATGEPGVDAPGIAKWQKAIIWLILLRILLIGAVFLAPFALRPLLGGQTPEDTRAAIMLVVLGVRAMQLLSAIAAIVFLMLMMSAMQSSTGARVGAAIGLLVPIVGLIVLLVVNGKATRLLRDSGYRVGLLGAKPTAG